MLKGHSLNSKGKGKGYYPLYLDINGKKVSVIGGGRVAERKILPLLDRGAKVTIISPDLTERLRDLVREGRLRHLAKSYEKGDLKGTFLVIVATEKKEINREILREAESFCCLYNVVDNPLLSNFIVPSFFNRGSLLIAISTSGTSPALSKRIRQELEKRYGREYALFLNMMEGIRKRLLRDVPSSAKRRKIFKNLVHSDLLETIKREGVKAARYKSEDIIHRYLS